MSLRDCFGLSMQLTCPPMRASGQFLPLSIEQHAADRRIGRRGAFMGPRQIQRMRECTQNILRRTVLIENACCYVHARLAVTSDEVQGK